MANLDFFAAHDDQIALIDFLFSKTDVRVWESDSAFGQELVEFGSAQELDQRCGLGVDRHGSGFAVTLALWSPSVVSAPNIRRIDLNPTRCDGHTFRYAVNGGGLMQLYFGGVFEGIITKSRFGHFSQKGAWACGQDQGVDWVALSKLSNKIQYHIRSRLAVVKVRACPVLPQAYALARQDYRLKDSRGAPGDYILESTATVNGNG